MFVYLYIALLVIVPSDTYHKRELNEWICLLLTKQEHLLINSFMYSSFYRELAIG